jgi:hypothetical protein
MKLNCERGDLAVIVRSDCGNEGTVVECFGLYLGPWLTRDGAMAATEPGWWLKRPFRGRGTGEWVWCVQDSKLRPLRAGDGVDEMVRLLGRPVAHDR